MRRSSQSTDLPTRQSLSRRSHELNEVDAAAAKLHLTAKVEDHTIVDGTYAMAAAAIGLVLTSITALVLGIFKGSSKLLGLESIIFAVWTVWLLIMSVYLTVYARTGKATASAFTSGGVALPQSIVEAQGKSQGISSVYWDKGYGELFGSHWLLSNPLSTCTNAHHLFHILTPHHM